MTIKASLQVNIAIVKDFLTRNFLSPVKICYKITGFGENGILLRGMVMKFCIWVGVLDVVTFAKFSDYRFGGLGTAGVNCPTFPLISINFLKALWHYRTSVWSACHQDAPR